MSFNIPNPNDDDFSFNLNNLPLSTSEFLYPSNSNWLSPLLVSDVIGSNISHVNLSDNEMSNLEEGLLFPRFKRVLKNNKKKKKKKQINFSFSDTGKKIKKITL